MSQDPIAWWAEVLFDRPASDGKTDESSFSMELLWMAEPNEVGEWVVLERIAELHERYSEWAVRYSAAQLSQGLWTLFSAPCFYRDWITDDGPPLPPFALRARAIRSLVVPYQVYVKGWNPNKVMPLGWHMLWDIILGHRDLARDIADVVLKCLQEILEIDDDRCQADALHGLNHLCHPDRPAVVQAWIDAHGDEDWNWRWVEACRDGKAM